MVRIQYDELAIMKLDFNSDDSGIPYETTGAASYSEYLQRVNEEVGSVKIGAFQSP